MNFRNLKNHNLKNVKFKDCLTLSVKSSILSNSHISKARHPSVSLKRGEGGTWLLPE